MDENNPAFLLTYAVSIPGYSFSQLRFTPFFSPSFVRSSEGVARGLRGGFLGVRRGKPHWTPSEPSLMSLCFPFITKTDVFIVLLIGISKIKNNKSFFQYLLWNDVNGISVLSLQIRCLSTTYQVEPEKLMFCTWYFQPDTIVTL